MHAGLQVITSCKIVLAAKSLHEDKDVQSLCSLRVLGPVSFVSSIAGEVKVAVEACAQEHVQNCAISTQELAGYFPSAGPAHLALRGRVLEDHFLLSAQMRSFSYQVLREICQDLPSL